MIVILTTSYLLGSNIVSDTRQNTETEPWKIKKIKNAKCKRKKSARECKRKPMFVYLFSLIWKVKKMCIIFKEIPVIFWALTEFWKGWMWVHLWRANDIVEFSVRQNVREKKRITNLSHSMIFF